MKESYPVPINDNNVKGGFFFTPRLYVRITPPAGKKQGMYYSIKVSFCRLNMIWNARPLHRRLMNFSHGIVRYVLGKCREKSEGGYVRILLS